LPIVVLIGFAVVVGLAAWYRSTTIAELTEQLASGDKTQAAAAVRQLAAITHPPLSVLVEAAASDERGTAEAAQIAINQLLVDWQHQLDKQERLNSVPTQVTQLANALSMRRRSFSTADYPWLEDTTREIMRLAHNCPPQQTPLVAMYCDDIMKTIGTTDVAARRRAQNAGSHIGDQLTPPATSTAPTPAQDLQHASLEQEFSAFPASPNANPQSAEQSLDNQEGTVPSTINSLRHDARTAHPSGLVLGNKSRLQGDAAQSTLSDDATLPPDWSRPVSRLLPTTPVLSSTIRDGASDAGANGPHSAVSAFAGYGTRELLERWRTTVGDDRREIETALAARGFRRLSAKLLQQYLSDDSETRLRAVDTALKDPGIDARPWLFLFATDEDADVRLAAVTVMATSDDKLLVEKAWQISIRDRDPRIADLSGRLRDRRGGSTLLR
jgi:hypothetical protein